MTNLFMIGNHNGGKVILNGHLLNVRVSENGELAFVANNQLLVKTTPVVDARLDANRLILCTKSGAVYELILVVSAATTDDEYRDELEKILQHIQTLSEDNIPSLIGIVKSHIELAEVQ